MNLQGNLPDAFFQLKTGLAGAVLQRFAIYHVRAAMVVAPELSHQGRFGEMVQEANRGRQFHVANTESEAVDWLGQAG